MSRPFASQGLRIERFDPERHDRSQFSSGVAPVDNFLKQNAGKLAKADNLRLFVMTEASGRIIGFYALNAHAVEYHALPVRFARARPAHGTIPAAFVSMIGVDERSQGRGLGGVLLIDALTRITRAAEAIGIAIVLLDILDCGDPQLVDRRRSLYESFGFRPLVSSPNRLFLPIATVRQLIVES